MTLNKYLDIAPEVQKALDEGRPVVALESTIISHGMPYPQNVETALNVEKLIREKAAAVLGRPVQVRFALRGQVAADGKDPMDALVAFGGRHEDIFTIK